jgi:sulfate adenylyltransferase
MSALGSVTGLPTWHPPRAVLELAELVLSGAIEPAAARIAFPDEQAEAEALVLEDAEGTPVAVLRRSGSGAVGFEPLRAFSHGPVRSARRSPAAIRAELAAGGSGGDLAAGAPGTGAGVGDEGRGSGGVLVVAVQSMLGAAAVDELLEQAAESGRALLWLAVFGDGRPSALPAEGLWRAVREINEQAVVAGRISIAVPVAVPWSEGDPGADGQLGPDGRLGADGRLIRAVGRAFAGDGQADVVIAAGAEQPAHPAFARERERAVPPPHRRGVTVFFTGLSGSGKSTVAKALADALAERSRRTVSLLDGDEVRRMLSAGLGFSRADRDLNIRRIGFVAAEVSRHGGIAICAPIAPFAQTRAQVRAMVEEVGDFVLIHVSTPLAECERRDRKGLYAKARRGEIPDFTGISSPYEVPVDADLRLDTSRMEASDALAAVWEVLAARGYLAPAD